MNRSYAASILQNPEEEEGEEEKDDEDDAKKKKKSSSKRKVVRGELLKDERFSAMFANKVKKKTGRKCFSSVFAIKFSCFNDLNLYLLLLYRQFLFGFCCNSNFSRISKWTRTRKSTCRGTLTR